MISSLINKNCSKYQAIELIFQKTGDCMKRFFILLPFAFFSFFAFAQTKLELYKDMVTTDNLRLRTPYAENKIITVLNKGTKVKIIDIEDEKETIDGITSNWVTVEVQKNAKDKDGNPVKYAVVGRCFAGYLKETPPISYVPNYENGNGQTNIITEAITEEYDGSYRNRWVRITVDGKTGWISGAYLSAERGGPTYYIPEDWIAFLKGDAP